MSNLLYSGKAKSIYTTDNPSELIAEFKNSLTAFNAKKKDEQDGKGALNAQISAALFQFLEKYGIESHFIKLESENTMRIKNLKMIPLEVVVRNIATGSLVKRYGIEKGKVLPLPIVELYYKEDTLDDPLMNDDHVLSFGLLNNTEELETIKYLALKVNSLLLTFFKAKNIQLVDFKLEFGYNQNNELILGDEMSPDNLRLWDDKGNSLDKDIFRFGDGNIIDAYTDVLKLCEGNKVDALSAANFDAEILITPRKDIRDPQGMTILSSLGDLGYKEVKDLRIGKYIELKLNSNSKLEAKQRLKAACEVLLANPVIEDYEIKVN